METKEISMYLPEGWKVERLFHYTHSFVAEAPSRQGFVSIDFNRRIFDIGYSQPLKHRGDAKQLDAYKGAGWKKRLVQDAVQHLINILES